MVDLCTLPMSVLLLMLLLSLLFMCWLLSRFWMSLLCFRQKNWDCAVCESNTTTFCTSSGACQMDEQCKQSPQVWGRYSCNNNSNNKEHIWILFRSYFKVMKYVILSVNIVWWMGEFDGLYPLVFDFESMWLLGVTNDWQYCFFLPMALAWLIWL